MVDEIRFRSLLGNCDLLVAEMGQALQKLRGGGRGGAALRGASPPRQPASHNIDPVQPSLSPSPQTVRQSVEVRPQAPEPRKCDFFPTSLSEAFAAWMF